MADLAALIADPLSALTVPDAEARALVVEANTLEAQARLVRELLTRRLASASANGAADADGVIDFVHVQEVAELVRHSVSWVRKRGHTLPGFHQPGGRGTRVAWARHPLEQYAGLASDT
jgi:hypothetical protein